MDYPNLGFPRFYFHGSLVITPCTSSVLQNFEDLNFVDDKLSAKTTKFTSLENLYVYGIRVGYPPLFYTGSYSLYCNVFLLFL